MDDVAEDIAACEYENNNNLLHRDNVVDEDQSHGRIAVDAAVAVVAAA